MVTMTFEEAKSGFFNREKVKRSLNARARKVLSRFGAYVWQRAWTSIRKKEGISPPGSPPYSHVGLLRRHIYFAYDWHHRSVVIGPTLLNSGSQVPSLLEYGGYAMIWDKGTKRRAYYRPRPYMRPAFEAELPQLPKLWRESVR